MIYFDCGSDNFSELTESLDESVPINFLLATAIVKTTIIIVRSLFIFSPR